MTGNEYQALAARTMNKKLKPFQQEAHALHLMASEVGEIHGIYQKSYQGHQIDNVALKKELGDLLSLGRCDPGRYKLTVDVAAQIPIPPKEETP